MEGLYQDLQGKSGFSHHCLIQNQDRAGKKRKDKRLNHSLLTDAGHWAALSEKISANELVDVVRNFNEFPEPQDGGFWTLYTITVEDTLDVPFLVYIPENYQASKKTPLSVYLHGAVVNRPRFADPAQIMNGLEIGLVQHAIDNGNFVLYPLGRKDFGWIYQQEAFETILKQIVFVKERYNIDDNRVYIGGHSNGGSGAFWFALKNPTTFSALYAFNHLPVIYSSNTTLRNLNNQYPFYGVSGNGDRTFPVSVVSNIYEFAKENGANWKNYMLDGDHGLPISKYDSVKFLFDIVHRQVRNPSAQSLEWETDDVRNGRVGWIEIAELDTTITKAEWHKAPVPSLVEEGKLQAPFNRNRSGAINARVEGNRIYLKSSRVKKVRIYISDSLFNLDMPISMGIVESL